MAFNKAPSQSTYQTKDVKLIMAIDNRSQNGEKDVIALNGFYDLIDSKEAQDQDYHFVKRDGTAVSSYQIPSSNIRGMYFWEEQDKLYVAYDTSIAIIRASTGVLLDTATPWATSTGPVGFTEFYYDNGEVKLVACDGSRLITISSTEVVVQGTDPDIPATMSPWPVFLDGYLFVIKGGTSDIYNSDLNNPLSFVSGDFISAEMLPDELVRIDRLNNYIVAFGNASIEYFFDAANASGSPLQRNDTPIKQMGYLGGLAKHGNKIYFIGKTAETSPEVLVLDDFKMEALTSFPLRRYLEPYSSFEGSVISNGGHFFYVVNVGTITYMVDLDTRLVTRLALRGGSTFPLKYATNVIRTGVGNTSIMVVDGDTRLYYFDPKLYQDDGTDFTATLQTDRLSFDTLHQKYGSRLILYADRPTTSAEVGVSWSDDDFQTFTTPRSVELNQSFPCLQRLGRFRQRVFKLSYTGNTPWRQRHMEIDFNIGSR